MKIKVVTPVRNAAVYIEKTFQSILDQSRPDLKIFYHVQDGCSSDNTIEICSKYEKKFLDANINFSYASEIDGGMYDAISKGFSKLHFIRCDVNCYINAGDFFAPRSFYNVGKAMRENNINWLTGINVKYNTSGDIIAAETPGPYPKKLIQSGVFGTLLPFIQQESTFWSNKLHSSIDFTQLAKYRLAGDFYLWSLFSQHDDLKVLQAWLSGFTIEPGQLSEVHRDKYFTELKSISKPKMIDYALYPFIGLLWLFPDKIKHKIFADTYYFVK